MEQAPYQPRKILDGGLLQSSAWQTFQQALGKEAFRVNGSDFTGRGFLFRAPWSGSYLYFPRGPLAVPGAQDAAALRNQLLAIGTETKSGWVRVEPQDPGTLAFLQEAFPGRVVEAPHPIQPKETFMVSLEPAEEALLAQMKSKTRYNIRLAERYGVHIRESRDPKDFPLFEELIQATTERKGIRAHPASYYRIMLESLPGVCRLFFAEHEGKALAANLVTFYGDTATYLHGGTRDDARQVMAPFLLQWEQMRTAKREGFARYDFGGVKVATRNDARWDGITRFKQGFAPAASPLLFPGTYDIILDAGRYRRYRFLRAARNLFT